MDATARTRQITTPRQCVLYAAALLPFLCSMAAHAVGVTSQPAAAGEPPAGLVFEQYLIDLGEVPPLPMLEAHFRFTNWGDRELTITDMKPSCGCLNPQLKKNVYQPGESGEFVVRVETAGEAPGPKEYFVDVFFQDTKPRRLQLGFDFILPERKVVVNPRALIFYQLNGEPTTREIIVSDYRDEPLSVTDWECDSPYVTAVVGTTETEPGRRVISVGVKVAGNVSPGNHQTLLRLKTDDPTNPELRVPLWIQGPSGEARKAEGSSPVEAPR